MTSRCEIVIVAIPVLLVGGTETQTLNLVSTLTGKGYQVKVCCYYEYEVSMVAAMKAAGARVEMMDLDRSAGLWHLLGQLKSFFVEQRPDIVHVQYIAPGLIPILAARLARVPTLFATVHQPGRTYGLKAKLLLSIATRLCTLFTCNSLAVERSWFGSAALFDPQHKHRRHCTIYNAVDVKRISAIAVSTDRTALRTALNLGDRPTVGVVGRLRWEKGQRVLLEAMVEVAKQIPSAMLLVVGDGPDREDLQCQAERLGITDNVLWLGQQNAEEVFRLFSVMDVVAVPSIFEGFGLVAAEAMAAGRPVVASAVDGLAEVVADGRTGALVPPGDIGALAAALVQLLKDPELARTYGKSGLKRCRDLFGLARFRDTTLAAYRCLLPKSWNPGP